MIENLPKIEELIVHLPKDNASIQETLDKIKITVENLPKNPSTQIQTFETQDPNLIQGNLVKQVENYNAHSYFMNFLLVNFVLLKVISKGNPTKNVFTNCEDYNKLTLRQRIENSWNLHDNDW